MSVELAPRPVEQDPLPTPEAAPMASETNQHPAFSKAEELGALSVEELLEGERIDPAAAEQLARKQVHKAFGAAKKYGQFTPALASAITHQHTPEKQALYPTAAQIKQENFGARVISGILGFFSPSWAKRFDNYLVRKARERLGFLSRRATWTIDTIASVDLPKQQFIAEMTAMQASLAREKSPKDTLGNLAEEAAEGQNQQANTAYPLLDKLISVSGARSRLIERRWMIRAFAPEITRGITQFLERQGVAAEQVQATPHNSLIHKTVSKIAPRFVANLPKKVELFLANTYAVLPENGKRFRANVYKLCDSIVEQAYQGHSGRELTKTLLTQVQTLIVHKKHNSDYSKSNASEK